MLFAWPSCWAELVWAVVAAFVAWSDPLAVLGLRSHRGGFRGNYDTVLVVMMTTVTGYSARVHEAQFRAHPNDRANRRPKRSAIPGGRKHSACEYPRARNIPGIAPWAILSACIFSGVDKSDIQA